MLVVPNGGWQQSHSPRQTQTVKLADASRTEWRFAARVYFASRYTVKLADASRTEWREYQYVNGTDWQAVKLADASRTEWRGCHTLPPPPVICETC